jgi:hypothetical protein
MCTDSVGQRRPSQSELLLPAMPWRLVLGSVATHHGLAVAAGSQSVGRRVAAEEAGRRATLR